MHGSEIIVLAHKPVTVRALSSVLVRAELEKAQ